jgi:hypothetical protein
MAMGTQGFAHPTLVFCFSEIALYGVRWGTLAGFIAGICTYLIWYHPHTTLTFTAEALFVG